MNSDEERELFESYGWTYDHVQRSWVAPDGFTVSIDDLVLAADALGPAVEYRLRAVAQEHGVKK